MSKSDEDFEASIRVLRAALDTYRSGTKDAYRNIATELRKLLCDSDPLLPRVHPEVQLHKFHWTELFERSPSMADGMTMMMPGRLTMHQDGSSEFELSFAKSRSMMDVKAWVEQPLLSPEISVRELLDSVADNDARAQARMFKYVKDGSHIPVIVALGDYLSKQLTPS